jgi:tetratricopeptide (TPR) repeat protein
VKLFNQKVSQNQKPTYREHLYLIGSLRAIDDIDAQIRALKEAILKFKDKDLFKRELANALEKKANSYADIKSYTKIKKNLMLESITILSDLYEQNPSKENFTALMKFYKRQGDYVETLALLENYGKSNPKGPIYYTYLCEALYKGGLYSRAIQTCEMLKKSSPENETAHLYYGKALKKAGEEKTAHQNFVKSAGRFPASSNIQFEAGKALIESGETRQGLKYLDQHLKIDKSDEALVLKADTLYSLKRYDDALKVYVEACKQHQEPRKPLILKIRNAAKNLVGLPKLKELYEDEVRRCRYAYRPSKKSPKGVLGGS